MWRRRGGGDTWIKRVIKVPPDKVSSLLSFSLFLLFFASVLICTSPSFSQIASSSSSSSSSSTVNTTRIPHPRKFFRSILDVFTINTTSTISLTPKHFRPALDVYKPSYYRIVIKNGNVPWEFTLTCMGIDNFRWIRPISWIHSFHFNRLNQTYHIEFPPLLPNNSAFMIKCSYTDAHHHYLYNKLYLFFSMWHDKEECAIANGGCTYLFKDGTLTKHTSKRWVFLGDLPTVEHQRKCFWFFQCPDDVMKKKHKRPLIGETDIVG